MCRNLLQSIVNLITGYYVIVKYKERQKAYTRHVTNSKCVIIVSSIETYLMTLASRKTVFRGLCLSNPHSQHNMLKQCRKDMRV